MNLFNNWKEEKRKMLASQMEEIYGKQHFEMKRGIVEWATAMERSGTLVGASPNVNSWRVRTLDTQRFVKMEFRPIEYSLQTFGDVLDVDACAKAGLRGFRSLMICTLLAPYERTIGVPAKMIGVPLSLEQVVSIVKLLIRINEHSAEFGEESAQTFQADVMKELEASSDALARENTR